MPEGYKPDDNQDYSTIDKREAVAIALGHRWMDLLTNGFFHSVQELAEEVGMDPSQVRRYLGLVCVERRKSEQ